MTYRSCTQAVKTSVHSITVLIVGLALSAQKSMLHGSGSIDYIFDHIIFQPTASSQIVLASCCGWSIAFTTPFSSQACLTSDVTISNLPLWLSFDNYLFSLQAIPLLSFFNPPTMSCVLVCSLSGLQLQLLFTCFMLEPLAEHLWSMNHLCLSMK